MAEQLTPPKDAESALHINRWQNPEWFLLSVCPSVLCLLVDASQAGGVGLRELFFPLLSQGSGSQAELAEQECVVFLKSHRAELAEPQLLFPNLL